MPQLDATVRRRILRRIVWLGENAPQIIHHPLANLPGELFGLCRLRVGDYRFLYWPGHEREILEISGSNTARKCIDASDQQSARRAQIARNGDGGGSLSSVRSPFEWKAAISQRTIRNTRCTAPVGPA